LPHPGKNNDSRQSSPGYFLCFLECRISGTLRFWHVDILATLESFNALKEVYASYFGNPTAYFAAKAGVYTKPNVKILVTISINFVPFLAILFVTFEYYQNVAPDHLIKKPWSSPSTLPSLLKTSFQIRKEKSHAKHFHHKSYVQESAQQVEKDNRD
jgi:hypothetical protein